MTDTLSLDRQRDAKIAEDNARDGAIEWALRPAASVVRYGPTRKFSADPVAFNSLIGEIGRRGLGRKWSHRMAMLLALPFDPGMDATDDFTWAVVSAPQSTKAAAALAVLTETTND